MGDEPRRKRKTAGKHHDGGITGFQYSPDMSKIFYIQSVKLDKTVHDLFPDLPKANARIENDLMYRHWDSWHDYTYNHVFIADYSKAKHSGERHHGR
jgi:hypothetical protein